MDEAKERQPGGASAADSTGLLDDIEQDVTDTGPLDDIEQDDTGPPGGYILALTEPSSEFLATQRMGNELNRQDTEAKKRAAARTRLRNGPSDGLTRGPSEGLILALTAGSSELLEVERTADDLNRQDREAKELGERNTAAATLRQEDIMDIPSSTDPRPPCNPLRVPTGLNLKLMPSGDTGGRPGAFRERGINAADEEEESGDLIHEVLQLRNDMAHAEEEEEPEPDIESPPQQSPSMDAPTSESIETRNPGQDNDSPEERQQQADDELLIEARLVASFQQSRMDNHSESNRSGTDGGAVSISEAKPLDEVEMARGFFRSRKGQLVLLVVSILVIGLALGHVARPKTDTTEPAIVILPTTVSPSLEMTIVSDSPTTHPTGSPTSLLQSNISMELLGNLSNATLNAIMEDENSPQYLALQWLQGDHQYLSSRSKEEWLQRYALRTLFYSTQGADYWSDTKGWNEVGERSCSWSMVSCEYTSEDDVIFALAGANNLNGTIPPELELLSSSIGQLALENNNLRGTIPSQLARLQKLNSLWLRNNFLSGRLPTEIASLTNLLFLDFSDNPSLTGPIPSEFGSNPKISSMVLSGNSHSGTIPSEIFSMEILQDLMLQGNRLSGSLPSEIWTAPLLGFIKIDRNAFSGSLPMPASGNQAAVLYFDADDNKLTGRIPSQLGSMTSLAHLSLSNNYFSGRLPTQIGVMWDLCDFSISNSGVSGSIPTELGRLCNGYFAPEASASQIVIVRGYLEYSPHPANSTSALLSAVNATFAAAVGSTFDGFESFTLTLQKELPQKDYYAYKERSIVVTGIFEQGVEPPTKEELGQFLDAVPLPTSYEWALNGGEGNEKMELSHVDFTWVFFLSQDSSALNISSNNFSGHLPLEIFGRGSFLSTIDAGSNSLSGTIPTTVGSTSNLEFASFGSNFLTGTLPSELGNLSHLQLLNISSNLLSGSIPSEIANATTIQKLDAHKNHLVGTIPSKVFCFDGLEYLDLSANQLSGVIPNICASKLAVLNLSHNFLSGPLPNGIPPTLCQVDLSHNQLNGTIPSDLAQACFRGIPLGQSSVGLTLNITTNVEFIPGVDASLHLDQIIWAITMEATAMYSPVLKEAYPHFEHVDFVYWEESFFYNKKTKSLSFALIMSASFSPGSQLPSADQVEESLRSAHFDYSLSSGSFALTSKLPEQVQWSTSLQISMSSTPVPLEVLPSLYLDLSFNNLSGTIPETLSALGPLGSRTVVKLNGNNLTGSLPTSMCPWLCASGNPNATTILEVDCQQIACQCDCNSSHD